MRISDHLLRFQNASKRPKKNGEDGIIEMIEKKSKQTVQADGSQSSLQMADCAYLGDTLPSSPLAAATMEISLPQCGMDDETLHSVLEGLSKECSSASWPETIEAASTQDIHMSLTHQRIGDGDYLSRIICLNLMGNCLTDLSCEVTCIVRTSCVRSYQCDIVCFS